MDNNDFAVQKPHRDLCLIVGDERFYVNKGVLGECSGVFRQMFFEEGSKLMITRKNDELSIGGFEAETVKSMLLIVTGTPWDLVINGTIGW